MDQANRTKVVVYLDYRTQTVQRWWLIRIIEPKCRWKSHAASLKGKSLQSLIADYRFKLTFCFFEVYKTEKLTLSHP